MYSKIVQLARLYHLFQHENGKVFTNVESQMQKSNVDFKYGISFTKRESRIAIHPTEKSTTTATVTTTEAAKETTTETTTTATTTAAGTISLI